MALALFAGLVPPVNPRIASPDWLKAVFVRVGRMLNLDGDGFYPKFRPRIALYLLMFNGFTSLQQRGSLCQCLF